MTGGGRGGERVKVHELFTVNTNSPVKIAGLPSPTDSFIAKIPCRSLYYKGFQGFTWQIYQRNELGSLAASRIHSMLPVRWCCGWLWRFCISWNKEPHFYTWNHIAIADSQTEEFWDFSRRVRGFAGAKNVWKWLVEWMAAGYLLQCSFSRGYVHGTFITAGLFFLFAWYLSNLENKQQHEFWAIMKARDAYQPRVNLSEP